MRLISLFGCLLLAGCGSWTFVSFPYDYKEPPELPLAGLTHYALAIEGARGAEFDPSCAVPGLKRTEDVKQADVLVRLTLSEPREEPMEAFQTVQWTASGRRAFKEPRYGVRWRFSISLSWAIEDLSRGTVIRSGSNTYDGLFHRRGMIFSTEAAGERWFLKHRGSDWVTNAELADAVKAGLVMLQKQVDEVTSAHPRHVRLRVAKESPELEGFSQAYDLLRHVSRQADAEDARAIYDLVGNPLHAADDPEDAIQHRHAVQSGLAACDFLTADYRGAKAHAEAALEQREAATLQAFLEHCEVMIQRTEIPPPTPRKKRKPR